MKKFLAVALAAILMTSAISVGTLVSATSTQTTIYGKVTAISSKKVTLALGTVTASSASSKITSSTTSSGTKGTPPSAITLKLNGKNQTVTISDSNIISKQDGPRGAPTGSTPTGSSAPSSKPDSAPSTSSVVSGSTSSSKPSKPSTKASLSDIKVGSILKITYTTSSKKLVSVVILNG